MRAKLNRRGFIHGGLAVATGGMLSAGAISRLGVGAAHAATGTAAAGVEPYGPLARRPDQRGVEVLALPAGFSYVTFGHIGTTMSDGNPTPLALDGMAAFRGPQRGQVTLVRNHEDRNPPGQGSVLGDPAARYDALGVGGTTSLVYDERRRSLVADFVSLNGTAINCAGGIGLGRRSWITAEETVGGPEFGSSAERYPLRHGYIFEVPVDLEPGHPAVAEPIRAAGRFLHEAVAVDQRTGIVYETEDAGSGRGAGFYRFLPDDVHDLRRGGRLQMLAVRGAPQADLREGQRVGRRLPVTWVDIEDPDPPYANADDPGGVFRQGYAGGGAKFNRLEGCWEDCGSVFFVSTSGGDAKNGDVNSDGFEEGCGQVWEYRANPSGGSLVLRFESPGVEVMDGPDNITVTPRGGLLTCEDDASSARVDSHPLAPGVEHVNRLVGLTPRGEPFEFAVNVLNDAELAGACFSPSGRTLFVNVYGYSRFSDDPAEGMTCAITGPWGHGPL